MDLPVSNELIYIYILENWLKASPISIYSQFFHDYYIPVLLIATRFVIPYPRVQLLMIFCLHQSRNSKIDNDSNRSFEYLSKRSSLISVVSNGNAIPDTEFALLIHQQGPIARVSEGGF